MITDKCECIEPHTVLRVYKIECVFHIYFLLISLKQTRSCKLEIEHKSLILAQIERWRHALHMQVERQHEYLYLVASGERVSNALERTE